MGKLEFRTLRADEIDCRVAQVFDTGKWQGVSLLLYKDARCDMNILDETVGCLNWQRTHSRENANCQVGIWDDSKMQWVWKEDTGTESFTEKEKGLCSDSFKRVCVNFGIGRELYSAPTILCACEIETDSKGKKVPKKGLSWQVSKIAYDSNRNISELEIEQLTRGKNPTVVFTWSK